MKNSRGDDAANPTNITIDARGLLCPLPVLRAAKRLRALAPGTRVVLLTDDPAAVVDVPHFCLEARHELLGREEIEAGGQRWSICRGA